MKRKLFLLHKKLHYSFTLDFRLSYYYYIIISFSLYIFPNDTLELISVYMNFTQMIYNYVYKFAKMRAVHIM